MIWWGEARGGLGMALKEWPRLATLAGTIVIAAVALTFVLGDVLTQVSVYRGASALRANHAVTFSPYYGNNDVTLVRRSTLEHLATQVRRGSAYTAVINNVQVDDADFADGRPVIVVIGSRSSLAMPGVRLCSPAPCAMFGYHLKGRKLPQLQLAGADISPTRALPPGATYVDPNAAWTNLDSSIVIRLAPRNLPQLNAEEREESVTHAVLIGPQPAAVDRLVIESARDRLYLAPNDLAISQPSGFRDLMIRSILYLTGLLALLVLVLLAFSATASAAFRAQARAFTIRRMCGARPSAVWIRTGSYVTAVTLAVPTPILLGLALLGPPFQQGAFLALAALVMVTTALWLVHTRRLLVNDMTGRTR